MPCKKYVYETREWILIKFIIGVLHKSLSGKFIFWDMKPPASQKGQTKVYSRIRGSHSGGYE